MLKFDGRKYAKNVIKCAKSRVLRLILASILLLALGSSEKIRVVRSESPESRLTTNTTEWYVETSDWVNVTLTQGVKVSLSRTDGMIHWYWPTNPLVDRRVGRWSAIRVETWGYNDGQCYENDEKITVTESFDKSWIVVNETWITDADHKTRVELYLVFYRDVPWFYCYAKQTYLVEPNRTTLSDWYRVGMQPQICVFLNGSDSICTPSPFNESKITQETMPITHQWMERFEKFPWIAMHDQDDNATVGVILLNVYPPCYDLMAKDKYANNQEAQITFMSAGFGGVSECWYFPKDFYWYTQFIVYPCFDDTPPYYDKIDKLSKTLYDPSFINSNFNSSFTSANHSPVEFDWPSEKGQPFILNKIGCLGSQGVIFWNGTFPRHYSGHPNNYILNFNQRNYNISSDTVYVDKSHGWNSTKAGTDSRQGYHVQCWKRQTFNYSAYELDVELKHNWEAWNDSDKFLWTTTLEIKSDSNLTKAYFWLEKGHSKVIQLNSTTWELYNVDSWGAEPSITLIFKNSTVEYSNGRWTCYLVNNTSQKRYLAGEKFTVSFYLWLHYGHIEETNQVTPIHTIQPQHIAPFHTHFHHSIDDRNVTGNFAFWTNATFVDAHVTHSRAKGQLNIIETGSGIGMTKVYCANYGEPEKVQVNGKNTSFQYNRVSKVLTFNIAFSSAEKNIANIVIDISDTTSPKTEITIGSPNYTQNRNTYVNSNTLFTLKATDKGFGIAHISFNVDHDPRINYSSPFTLAGYRDGQHTIHYFSVDKTGNIEIVKTIDVIIDNLSPTTTCNPPKGSYSRPVTINFTSTDKASGVKSTYYSVSAEKWIKYTGPFSIPEQGCNEIFYYSVDNLGNKETTKSTSYTIQEELPPPPNFLLLPLIVTMAVTSAIAIARILKERRKR